MKLIHIMKIICFTQSTTHLNVNFVQKNTFIETSTITFDQISGHCCSAKLIHKINHHRSQTDLLFLPCFSMEWTHSITSVNQILFPWLLNQAIHITVSGKQEVIFITTAVAEVAWYQIVSEAWLLPYFCCPVFYSFLVFYSVSISFSLLLTLEPLDTLPVNSLLIFYLDLSYT